MLRVAICDDDAMDRIIVKDLLVSLMYSLNIEFEIEEFSDGNSLLNSIISFDLLLLDIEMSEMNGIEIARKLRLYNNECKIIFITNSREYLRTGYTVKADGYFIKPIDRIEFNYELSNILKESMIDNKFLIDKRIGSYKLYINKILYIEYFDRKTFVHLLDSEIATHITLKEWNSLLGSYYFSQCHKAYIINLRHVTKLKTDSVILSNNKEIGLSRKYKIRFKEDYFLSIGEKV